MPHVPWQGSRQCERMHAREGGQSASDRHSGRHPEYGSPLRPGSHSQEAPLPLARQIAPGPHGDGLHGSFGGAFSAKLLFKISFVLYNKKT